MKKLELGPTSTVEFEAKLTLMTLGDMHEVAELAATGEQFEYLGFVARCVSFECLGNFGIAMLRLSRPVKDKQQ